MKRAKGYLSAGRFWGLAVASFLAWLAVGAACLFYGQVGLPAGEVVKAAKDLAKKILSKGQVAVRLAMESVDEGLKVSLKDGLLIEADKFAEVMKSDDAHEGVSAFLQKRQAKFQDK